MKKVASYDNLLLHEIASIILQGVLEERYQKHYANFMQKSQAEISIRIFIEKS